MMRWGQGLHDVPPNWGLFGAGVALGVALSALVMLLALCIEVCR